MAWKRSGVRLSLTPHISQLLLYNKKHIRTITMNVRLLSLFLIFVFITSAGIGCRQELTTYGTNLSVWGVFDNESYYGGGNRGNLGGCEAEAIPADGHPQSVSLTLPPLSVVVLRHT